jgi:hypothetical protein
MVFGDPLMGGLFQRLGREQHLFRETELGPSPLPKRPLLDRPPGEIGTDSVS